MQEDKPIDRLRIQLSPSPLPRYYTVPLSPLPCISLMSIDVVSDSDAVATCKTSLYLYIMCGFMALYKFDFNF